MDQGSGALSRLDDLELPGAPVVDGSGMYRGCAQRHVLAQFLSEWGGTPPVISQVADPQAVSLPDNLSLAAAVDAVAAARAWVPVVDQRRAVVGIRTAAEVLAGYRMDQHRGTSTAEADMVLVEEHVQVASSFARRHVADLGLPDGSLVASMSRHGHPVLPTSETVVEAGDLLRVLTPAGGVVVLRRSLATNPTQAEPDNGQGLGAWAADLGLRSADGLLDAAHTTIDHETRPCGDAHQLTVAVRQLRRIDLAVVGLSRDLGGPVQASTS